MRNKPVCRKGSLDSKFNLKDKNSEEFKIHGNSLETTSNPEELNMESSDKLGMKNKKTENQQVKETLLNEKEEDVTRRKDILQFTGRICF